MNLHIRRAMPLAPLLLCIIPAYSQKVAVTPWGTADGKQVSLYTLKNASGMEVKITNYGGTIASVVVPDKNKKFGDVVLGFNSLAGYTSTANDSYFGATIGRYGNRIAGGKFKLDGKTYQVPKNEKGVTALHSGTKGFDKHVWDAKDVSGTEGPALEIHRVSPDGEMGFPGNLDVTVRFTVTKDNALRIDYSATTDKDTVLNLTNHSYFNLSGPGSGTVLDDKLMLDASKYTPVNKTLIPTGSLDAVAGTPFDFKHATAIGSRINDKNQQLEYANGYDQNWALDHPGDLSNVAARVEDPKSGRVLEVYTTQPGIQFYTGNFLKGNIKGIGGTYSFRGALCLETQHFPDSPNHSNFPSTELKPGDKFQSVTIYKFSTK
jgi:aldose 1-epimerase